MHLLVFISLHAAVRAGAVWQKSVVSLKSVPRGGSTATDAEDETTPPLEAKDGKDVDNDMKVKQWILQQIRTRQERIVLLSQSLSERGLPFAGLSSISESIVKAMGGGVKVVQPPEWVCEMSTEESPKACLIWGDAEPGTKVVRPRNAPDQCVCVCPSALCSLVHRLGGAVSPRSIA